MKLMCKQLALTLVLAVMSVNMAQAVVPAGQQVSGTIKLPGGSDATVKWAAPFTFTYKVHVLVPATGKVTNALYRVYPKGKKAGSTTCVSTDISYPCFEVTVDQTQYPNMWVQLTLNGDAATRWGFIKGKGYVTAVTDNLGAAELLNLSALARFEKFENLTIAIGKTYQGGIIFYVDDTGEHGLIAAPTDQSDDFDFFEIPWADNPYIATYATGTAVGTGKTNTKKIVTVSGNNGLLDSAVDLCYGRWIGLYSDWFMPSKGELDLMYRNIGPGAAAPLTNIGGFAAAYYWSSSESGDEFAWYQYFGNGNWYNYGNNKGDLMRVRPVRAF